MNLPDPGEPVGGVAPVCEVESGEPEERPPAGAPHEVRGALLDHVVLLVAAHVERPPERERNATYEINDRVTKMSHVQFAPLPSCTGRSGHRNNEKLKAHIKKININLSTCL